MSEEQAAPAPSKRPRKLLKSVEGTVLTIEIPAINETLSFDMTTFTAVQEKLAMYGLSQKLGDAAAGRDGLEAKEAIEKVAAGLAKGDWSTRAPAAPKVTKKQITENLSNMSDKEQAAARELLAKIGISI